MRYEILGENLPVVSIHLDKGESIYTQSGGMSWMTEGIEMSTNMKGGLMKGFGRMLTGDSLFMATYTAEKPGQEIAVASAFPGSIIALEVGGGKEYVCQKQAFLCAQPTVELSVETIKGLTGGFFGGEGFLLQRLKGSGIAWVEIDGSVIERTLAPGERLKVDTGNVAIYESTVKYSVETVKGFKNILFGGEGMFLTILEGPGKVWLQTITLPGFAGRLIPYIPSKS